MKYTATHTVPVRVEIDTELEEVTRVIVDDEFLSDTYVLTDEAGREVHNLQAITDAMSIHEGPQPWPGWEFG